MNERTRSALTATVTNRGYITNPPANATVEVPVGDLVPIGDTIHCSRESVIDEETVIVFGGDI
jgi:hypothetical protein